MPILGRMEPHPEKRVITAGKYVNLSSRGGWEFVERKNISGIVAIVAVTDEGKLLLVEQYRPPMDKRVIELPAGLAGDAKDNESEELLSAARRELLEETGYEAREFKQMCIGGSSAGITDEVVAIFRATGLTKTGKGEGDGTEQLTLLEIPLDGIDAWLDAKVAAGWAIDLKVYCGLYFTKAAAR